MLEFSGHRFSPMTTANGPKVAAFDPSQLFDVVDLSDDIGWNTLHESVIAGVKYSKAPWNRCLSVLRGHGATTCVIEHYYVCLDLRGEVAAFNAQLDAPVERAAIRLHFFVDRVANEAISTLSDSQKASYLGYIVCRRPGSPIVGRTLLRTPEYVQNSCEILESVNFFGQNLKVRGVPFMQQDERYAVCAHVAAWTLLYSAHRKKIIERRLVSDVVAATSPLRSMHPAAPVGLSIDAVQSAIQTLGLHFPIMEVIGEGDLLTNFSLRGEDFQLSNDQKLLLQSCLLLLSRYMGENDGKGIALSFDEDHKLFLSSLWRCLSSIGADCESALRDAGGAEPQRMIELAVSTIDAAVFSELKSHLNSGFPLYCQTSDHATVLCGYSENGEDGNDFFFHDDQFGPYLKSKSIVWASKAEFRLQSYSTTVLRNAAAYEAPRDDLAEMPASFDIGREPNRGVLAIGLCGPARLLLKPSFALSSVRAVVDSAKAEWFNSSIADSSVTSVISDNYRASVIMGIDYKRQRLESNTLDVQSRLLISSLHLAEWVVVVEMLSDSASHSIGDFVYDGSSSSHHPLLQFGCLSGQVLYRSPTSWPDIDVAEIPSFQPLPLQVPDQVKKG